VRSEYSRSADKITFWYTKEDQMLEPSLPIQQENHAAPTHADMVARARDLIPLLRERAEEDAANRMIRADTVKRMKEAGLFRVLQSKRWGGYELGQRTFAEVQMALAEGDMSAAWIYGVIGVHAYHLCLFEDQAARDVWGDDSSVLIASPYMPTGKAIPVPGGYEFSGRWSYSSGCDHCDWTFLGGIVDGDPTDYRSFLLPREDTKIIDTWQTTGLAATGSQDILVEKAFVPEYRTHKMIDGFNGSNPGRAINDGQLFRMPFMLVFLRCITSGQIGALQALVDIFQTFVKDKTFGGTKTADDPVAQLAIADALAGIDTMKKTMFANFEIMSEFAARDEMPPFALRQMMRYQSALVAEQCLNLATPLIRISGGGGVYDRVGMGKIYRDMITGRQHVAAQFQSYGRKFGGLVLTGASANDILL